MSFVRVSLLGNGSWGKQFAKKPQGTPNKQKIWVLVYDNGLAGDYTCEIASDLHDWDPPRERDRRANDLGRDYKILIFESNPHGRAPAAPDAPISVPDTVTITVTNQRTNDKGSDKQPVVIVDGARYDQVARDIEDDELFDLLAKSDLKAD